MSLVAPVLTNDKLNYLKSVGSYNIFEIRRSLDHISKDYSEVIELKSGDLLIKANDLKPAEKVIHAQCIDIVPVKITLKSS